MDWRALTRIFLKMAFSFGGRGSELGILVIFLSLKRQYPSKTEIDQNQTKFQMRFCSVSNLVSTAVAIRGELDFFENFRAVKNFREINRITLGSPEIIFSIEINQNNKSVSVANVFNFISGFIQCE